MKIGMLWYSPDTTKTLPEKIGEAVAYYRTKYGREANVCFVNPKTLDGQASDVPGPYLAPTVIEGVTVKGHRSIMPNHFWVGVE